MNMKCRSCGSDALEPVISLGRQSPSNALLNSFEQEEKLYPLTMLVCRACCLMQTSEDVPHEELFGGDYPYFSGGSRQWRDHCRKFAAEATNRFRLSPDSLVMEIGGNDGTLLRNFECRTLNIEPAKNVAAVSERHGVRTINSRFQDVKEPDRVADLIVANNVIAHDPDLHGFAKGIRTHLAVGGTASIEFPWAVKMLEDGEFDTIYHEHYSYLSITALDTLCADEGLRIYDANYLDMHGGSIRAFLCHNRADLPHSSGRLDQLRKYEQVLRWGQTYGKFRRQAADCSRSFNLFLNEHRGARIFGMGAAAKATVFTNFCGITYRDIPFVGDVTPAKWGKWLPGSRIAIVPEADILAKKPDFIVIFPWNWKNEIAGKMRGLGYDGKFVTAIPKLEIFA